jgi:FMN reductase
MAVMGMVDRIVTVVGNPKPDSQTLHAARTLAEALGDATVGSPDGGVIDLATIADGLLAPWRQSPTAKEAGESARSAALLVIGTPTYKASFSGLLKLFLDTFPAGSLSRTVVVPVILSGGPAHRHLADIQLRPVLSELAAVAPAPSFLVEESEMPDVTDLARDYARDYGPVLGAAVAALRGG